MFALYLQFNSLHSFDLKGFSLAVQVARSIAVMFSF